MTIKLDLHWIPTARGLEAHIEGGGIFGIVEPDTATVGSYRWTLASELFRNPFGTICGSCASSRHAKRSVERIRLARLRTLSARTGLDRLVIVDDVVETICNRLDIQVCRYFNLHVGGRIDLRYDFNSDEANIAIPYSDLTCLTQKGLGSYVFIDMLKHALKHVT